MLTGYPCISLHQPYASALFLDVQGERLKTHETRSFPLPPKLVGKRVAIHAAKKPVGLLPPELETALCIALGSRWRQHLPLGSVLGSVRLMGAARMPIGCGQFISARHPGHPASVRDYHFGHWEGGRWAWQTDDPRLLPAPIPTLGRQGWFSVEFPP